VGLSFLGPFLAPSVFPEEDPGVAEKSHDCLFTGLEIVGLSFLGPFLAPSVFPEEDPGVAEKYFSEKIIPSELKTASKDLQQDLGGWSSFFKYFIVFYSGIRIRLSPGLLVVSGISKSDPNA
jgi:hypothetical protein